ncbi:hypothetical protein [Streptomyces sp. NPDC048639]|uniref:hypothetical protein n=1 Tax=Streptomyces sp. NPDC048639 TaxID=3365581 RepID=UPI00371B33AF
MDPIVLAAGSALVSAMATDGWQQARSAVLDWWRRRHGEDTEDIATDLDLLRARILTAREEADDDTENALYGTWSLRFQRILEHDPALASELQRLLDHELLPVLPHHEQARTQTTVMSAQARDNARVFMAGRDQHINDA